MQMRMSNTESNLLINFLMIGKLILENLELKLI